MNRKILTIAMVTLVIDQITKTILENIIKLGTTKQIIKNFFYITTVHNDGAAWGIFSNNSIIYSYIPRHY